MLRDPVVLGEFGNTTPFSSNPVKTREDLAGFLTGILDALAPHTSPGGSRIHLGHTATHYDEHAALLEGFSRPIWGLASLIAGGGTYAGAERWSRGLASGTDPNGPEFWGDMRDKDQRMVECSAIGFALAVAGDTFWAPLTEKEKDNLGRWLGIMNTKEMPNTNWLWFRVFANLGLTKVGSPYGSAERIKADLDHLDTFYVGDGWSRDGPPGILQLDYYSSSFAIQFAQLAYSKIAQKEDPGRCEEYRNRARAFALDFVRYFDDEGRAIPFGRSMTYRFAMSSFWGALAFADVEPPAPLSWGVIKGLQLRNVRWWTTQPGAYNPDGTFTIGFCYPNHNMTENYNSPGSPYWACKSFVTLALPPSHPFWSATEEPLPSSILNTVQALPRPLHIASNLGGHTFILSSGQRCSYPVKQSAAKYGKFAYSAAFGYSVPTGSLTLEEHAADSALALSDDEGETFKERRATEKARLEHSADGKRVWLRSMWYPWKGVEVETWLVPPNPESPNWHLRVHRLKSDRPLRSAEGGWAIYSQGKDGRHLAQATGEDFGTFAENGMASATSKAGVSRITAMEGPKRRGEPLRTDANSNLMVNRAIVPTLHGEHEPGEQWLVTAVFGLPGKGEDGAPAGWESQTHTLPNVPQEIEALINGHRS